MSAQFNLRGELLASEHERKVARHIAGEVAALFPDPEMELREILNRKGVSQSRQDEIIADATAKAQPGYMDRFFPPREMAVLS